MHVAKTLLVLLLMATPVWSQEPSGGDSLSLSVQAEEGLVNLDFRYCPTGTLRQGRPKSPPQDPLGIQSFYVLETEVTGEMFTNVLGNARLQTIKQRTGENLRDLLDNPQLPVFHVDFDDVYDFCRQLNQLYQQQQDRQGSQLETRRFRLPTHLEWQYACRAVQQADAGSDLPHFNNWPRSLRNLDQITQNKCQEEWQEMGRADEFTGTQEQVVAIVSARHQPNNPKPLEILRAFLQAGLGTGRDYATTPDPPPLAKPSSGKPNAWQIYDMHNNVREWTLYASDAGQADETWASLLDPEARQKLLRKGMFFLSGGSFVDNAFGASGWQKFTIWGGFTQSISGEEVGLIARTGDIVAFSFKDLEDSDLLYEQVPGFRIVMIRGLRDDWRQLVRDSVTKSDQLTDQSLDQLDTHRATIQQLLPAAEQNEALAWVDYYTALAATRLGKADVAKRLLQGDSMQSLRKTDPYFAALADLVDKPLDGR